MKTITIPATTVARPAYTLVLYRCDVCGRECGMREGALPPRVDATSCPHQWVPQ